jgi:transcription elongation factor GreA
MEKIPMTLKGYERLQAELKHLKSVERPAVIRAIAEAREHGDLSENAEYAAAREKQSFIEGRIEELDAKTSRADVIDPKKLSGDKAVFGAHITVVDEDTEQEITYQLVGVDEADIHQCRLSITAPLGKALIGKKKGDSVEVRTPGGVKAYAVLKIAFIG